MYPWSFLLHFQVPRPCVIAFAGDEHAVFYGKTGLWFSDEMGEEYRFAFIYLEIARSVSYDHS